MFSCHNVPMQPPIFGFNEARGEIVREVVRRVCEGVGDDRLVLNEGAFLEVKRQEATGSDDVVPLSEWREIARSLGRMTDAQCSLRVRELAERYAREVAGNFDARVYQFATRAVPPIIGMLMSPL